MSAPGSRLVAPGGSGAMFDAIAPRYDLLNRLLSLGIDQRWRRLTAEALRIGPGERVLDLATGTADLALRVAALAAGVRVVGLDPSPRMLAIAREKIARAGAAERVSLALGDAERLPFAAGMFDGACMAFGIRNVADRATALREIARVTRSGGRIAILELGEPRRGPLRALARFHVHRVVPAVGALLSGAGEYRYLEQSIARFPPAEEFASLMRQVGLTAVEARPLTLGVCCLFTAISPGVAATGEAEGGQRGRAEPA